jgi:hypothetical protein
MTHSEGKGASATVGWSDILALLELFLRREESSIRLELIEDQ